MTRIFLTAIGLFLGPALNFANAAEETSFRAGAAVVDITPQPGVSMNGSISKPGPVLGVNDRLHARALVLDDGTTRLAMVVVDACMVGEDVFTAAKAIVEKESGLRADRMLMAATHSHAVVRLIHVGTGKLDDAYHQEVSRKIARAVLQAEKNLAPARIGYASFDKPEFLACRRFLCEPGSVGPNPFGETGETIQSVAMRSSQVIQPAGPVDPEFSILSVQHADGTPLAVLGNYSVHYCGGYRKGIVSADYFGHYAAALEEQLDGADNSHPAFVGMMSNGTSGDTGGLKNITGEKYPPYARMKEAGGMLAGETLEEMKSIEYRDEITLAMVQSELELGVRKPDAERLEWARAVLGNPEKEYPHRWSKIYAEHALRLAEYPETVSITLQAICIGDIAITAMPCEVFAESGLRIKAESPFEKTFSMELANGYGGYLPTPEQHELGGYETWEARSSFLEVGAEPKIVAEVLRLLGEVKKDSDDPAHPHRP